MLIVAFLAVNLLHTFKPNFLLTIVSTPIDPKDGDSNLPLLTILGKVLLEKSFFKDFWLF